MIQAKGKFEFSAEGAKSRISGLTRRAQFSLDQQIAKDSNYFCPEDTESLRLSVLPSAASGDGMLEWNEAYARKQYYEAPNKSKDKNPNASMKWFEKAKALYKIKWVKVAQRGFTK